MAREDILPNAHASFNEPPFHPAICQAAISLADLLDLVGGPCSS